MSKPELQKVKDKVYFAAANSGYGFISFYDRIFKGQGIKKRYIIKGGSGTGKSSLLRRIANASEAKGREVEYYLCSSDPTSLDGIIIDRAIAVMDGTAPHSVDTEIAGARDEIIDTLVFCNTRELERHTDEIISLASKKSECYSKAYKYLSILLECKKIRDSVVYPSLMNEKLKRSVRKSLADIQTCERGYLRTAILSSFGMKGRGALESFDRQAERVFYIKDSYSLGVEYLKEIIAVGEEKGQSMTVSYSQLEPENPDAVLFHDIGDCYIIGTAEREDVYKCINMGRFVDGTKLSIEAQSEYRALLRLEKSIIPLAEAAMADAGRYHFLTEKIYVSCMDFDKTAPYFDELAEKISSY